MKLTSMKLDVMQVENLKTNLRNYMVFLAQVSL